MKMLLSLLLYCLAACSCPKNTVCKWEHYAIKDSLRAKKDKVLLQQWVISKQSNDAN